MPNFISDIFSFVGIPLQLGKSSYWMTQGRQTLAQDDHNAKLSVGSVTKLAELLTIWKTTTDETLTNSIHLLISENFQYLDRETTSDL